MSDELEIVVDEDGVVLDDEPRYGYKARQAIEEMAKCATTKSIAERFKIDPQRLYTGASGLKLWEFEDIARTYGYVVYCLKEGEPPIRLADGHWWFGDCGDPLGRLIKDEASKHNALTLKVWVEGDEVKMKVVGK